MNLMNGLLVAAFVSAVCGTTASRAEEYPSRAVTAVPAFPPGAPNDFIMRLVGEQFRTGMKQSLIVDNRPGAAGNIAAELVARSLPDGYTLLATIDTVVTANPSLYKTLNFKADADLAPVIYLANTAQMLVCHPAVPVKTLSDFIDYARSHPLDFASGGQGVPGHLAAELFMAASGVKMTHVAYKGPGPATQDVLAAVVPCGFLATPVVMPHVKSGKLTALGVTSSRRSPIAPNVPTIEEAGIAGYEAAFGEVLLAPVATPASIVARLNAEMSRILQQPDIREKMLAADLEFVPNTPQEAAMRLQTEGQRWKRTIAELGLKIQ